MQNDQELRHHGVKGMKWGVRRERRRQLKNQKKWEKNVRNNWYKAYNRATNESNRTLDDFNSKKKYDNIDRDPKAYGKYVEDYCKRFNNIYVKELESTFGRPIIDKGREWCEMAPMFLTPENIDSIAYH